MEKSDSKMERWDSKRDPKVLLLLYVFPSTDNKLFTVVSNLAEIIFEGTLAYGEIIGRFPPSQCVVCNSYNPVREMFYQYAAISLPGSGSHMSLSEVKRALLFKPNVISAFKQTTKNLMQSTLFCYSNVDGSPVVFDTKGKTVECDAFKIRDLSHGYNLFVLADPANTDLQYTAVQSRVVVFHPELDPYEAWNYLASTTNPAYSMYSPDLVLDPEVYTSAKDAIDFMRLGATLAGSSLTSSEAAHAIGAVSENDPVKPIPLDDTRPVRANDFPAFVMTELSKYPLKEAQTSKVMVAVNKRFKLNFTITEFAFILNQFDGFTADINTCKVWIK